MIRVREECAMRLAQETQNEDVQGDLEVQSMYREETGLKEPQVRVGDLPVEGINGAVIQQMATVIAGALRMYIEDFQERVRGGTVSIIDFCHLYPPIFQGEMYPVVAEG